MIISVGVACLVVGLIVGFIVGATAARGAVKQDMRLLASQKFEDQLSYFGALRREIANILITDNPRRFLELYEHIHHEMQKFEFSDQSSKDARLKEISERYPYINEFDPFQTHDYVLYADTGNSIEELSALYEDILVYVAIMKSTARGTWQGTTSDKVLEHLHKYVRRIEDTIFQHEIAAAYRQVRAFEDFVEPLLSRFGIGDQWHDAVQDIFGPGIIYWTPEFSAHMIDRDPEDGYGFMLNAIDDLGFGIVTHFVGDHEIYYSIERTDAGFEEDKRLSCLTVDRISVPFEFMAHDAVSFRTGVRQ